jgi:hypothetical protein
MLYYTVSTKPEDVQTAPSSSLGGYKSSSQIPNGEMHNIFPKITQQTVIDNRKIIRMIVISNPTPSEMTNINIWSDVSQYSIIKMDAIAPAINASGDPVFEKVANENQIPYQATLQERLLANPLIIDTLGVGECVGVWLRKELDLTKFNVLEKGGSATCEELQSLIAEQNLITEDQVNIHIQWD